MAPEPVLLEVDSLTTVFPGRGGRDAAAVDDVSFHIDRGETLGLVGESGSGKSITALSIVGLVSKPGRIAAGSVRFDGQQLVGLDDAALSRIRGRRIGFIFQEPMVALNPVYTIGRHIEETLAVHDLSRGNAARRRAVELLESVRIPDAARRADEYPHQLSGGLRQRAMIALALSAEPDLVIADEPTTALDVTVQAEILELLADRRETLGLSLLLITHDLGVVAMMTDRVAVMYAGQIVETGSTRSILRTPAHPYTRALLNSSPGAVRGERLQAIAGVVPPLDDRPAGCRFAPRCPARFDRCSAPPPQFALTPIQADASRSSASLRSARCFLHEGRA
jgi:oligopeptide/dipeptide ABC transporter ATP-binding protein